MTVLFDRLVQASLEGSLLIAGVWLACRLAPALPASFRVVLWWLAALKLLVGLAGIDPIPLPILPPAALPLSVQSQLVADGRAEARPYEDRADPGPSSYVGPSFSSGITRANWRPWATGTWLIAVGALLLVALRQRQRTRRLIASAGPAEPQLLDVVDALAERVGLVAPPDTLRADRVESPMVAGLFTPVVLLPRAASTPCRMHSSAWRSATSWCTSGAATCGLAACRHWPSACFSSTRWRTSPRASTACARGGLRRGRAARDGRHATGLRRLLLALGVSPLGAGFAASSTSRSFSSLKRRIGMLNHTTPSARARYAGWLLAAAAAVAIVPMQVVARTAPAASRTPTPVEQDFSPAPAESCSTESRRVRLSRKSRRT